MALLPRLTRSSMPGATTSTAKGRCPDYLQNLGTIDVAAGSGFNVVLGDDFNARVWGDTPSGLDSVPAAAVAADLLEVAAGHDHALAKSSAGKVFAWGSNSKGQTLVPISLATTTVQAVAAGNGFSMALTSGGKVVVWGDNTYGQRNIPSALDGKKVVQIAAGARHALALTSDNEIVAWGSNGEGALDVPALAPRGASGCRSPPATASRPAWPRTPRRRECGDSARPESASLRRRRARIPCRSWRVGTRSSRASNATASRPLRASPRPGECSGSARRSRPPTRPSVRLMRRPRPVSG
ncbi:hypothetical protein [Aeromicrobium sp. UC242_57]|uniref:hypothetical protein n=1 Tax=Aeromicrobium sp. UC242_57 TaxID=3374624 RepID=UPI00378D08A3